MIFCMKFDYFQLWFPSTKVTFETEDEIVRIKHFSWLIKRRCFYICNIIKQDIPIYMYIYVAYSLPAKRLGTLMGDRLRNIRKIFFKLFFFKNVFFHGQLRAFRAVIFKDKDLNDTVVNQAGPLSYKFFINYNF